VTAFILYRAFRQMSTLFSKKFSMNDLQGLLHKGWRFLSANKVCKAFLKIIKQGIP